MSETPIRYADPPQGSDARLSFEMGNVVVSFPRKGAIRTYWKHVAFSLVFALAGISLLFVPMPKTIVPLWRLLPICVFASGA